MKVIVIREFLNGREIVPEGRELSVTEARGKALMKNNLVVPAPSELGAGTVRTRRAAQPAGTASPTKAAVRPARRAAEAVSQPAEKSTPSATRRTGGRTGEAKPRSSSRQARPRTSRRSTKGEDAPAS